MTDLRKRQSTDGENIGSLEKRIQVLENRFWVAGAIAVIFGVSGAWGFSMLHDAQKQLVQLQGGVQTVKDARDAALESLKKSKETQISDFNQQAKEIAKQAVSGEVGAQLDAVKRWTQNIYEQANKYDISPGSFASGAWQKALIGEYPRVQNQLK